MKTLQFIGIAGVMVGMLGLVSGTAIAAEPPNIATEDLSGLMSADATFETINGIIFGYSNAFIVNENESGDLFVIRMFSIMSEMDGRDIINTTIRQADCSGMRIRNLTSHTTIDGETASRSNKPTEWMAFGENSIVSRACTQAYSDRGIGRTVKSLKHRGALS